MRILIINGSPRGEKSSTLKVANALVEGIRREGDAVDLVDISKHNIEGCRGCFACWVNGGKCAIQDDFFKLFKERHLPSDLIIWSFPLYYFGIPSQLKAYIDRQFINLWPDMTIDEDGCPSHPLRWDESHISHIAVSTCGFFTAEGLYDAVLANFRLIFRHNLKEAITCGEGGCFMGGKAAECVSHYLDVVKRAGREYRDMGSFSKETRTDLMKPIVPTDAYNDSTAAAGMWKLQNTR